MTSTRAKQIFGVLIYIFISGCTSVVEPISIPYSSPDASLQEQFPMEIFPLTFETAKKLNLQRYPRFVSLPGNFLSAKIINEEDIVSSQFPPTTSKFIYLLGVGDELDLIQTIEVKPSFTGSVTPFLSPSKETKNFQSSPPDSPIANIIKTSGRVGSDGSILLIGVGRLEAKGRNINELRDEVRSILIRNGQAPNFQLEITGFNSQKAYISTDAPPDEKPDQIKYVLPITDNGTTLRELIATAGVAFNQKVLTLVKVQRDGQTFAFSLADLFSETAPEIYLKANDHIFIQNLEYVEGKVFLIAGTKPKLLSITPEKRQTLAQAIFSANGPLADPTAQRSAIYLLRGYNPVKAYHLDAQNPARILVADAVELRPNDIVFAAEQPISTFNRAIETLIPLRLLSRDTEKGNLP